MYRNAIWRKSITPPHELFEPLPPPIMPALCPRNLNEENIPPPSNDISCEALLKSGTGEEKNTQNFNPKLENGLGTAGEYIGKSSGLKLLKQGTLKGIFSRSARDNRSGPKAHTDGELDEPDIDEVKKD